MDTMNVCPIKNKQTVYLGEIIGERGIAGNLGNGRSADTT